MSKIDTITVVDTETTGTDPSEGAVLLEVSWVTLTRGADGLFGFGGEGTYDSWLIRHDGPIPAETRAVHHISPAMVGPDSGALERAGVVHSLCAAEVPGEQAYAAHNAKFDSQFLPELGAGEGAGEGDGCASCVPWICTYRCAMHLYPDAPRYGNQVLRYWLGAEPPETMLCEHDGTPLAPHRALYDTAVTAAVLVHMLQDHTAEELLCMTREPVLQKTIRFGKHRDTLWSELPRGYLEWMGRQSDWDMDVAHTLRHHLERA